MPSVPHGGASLCSRCGRRQAEAEGICATCRAELNGETSLGDFTRLTPAPGTPNSSDLTQLTPAPGTLSSSDLTQLTPTPGAPSASDLTQLTPASAGPSASDLTQLTPAPGAPSTNDLTQLTPAPSAPSSSDLTQLTPAPGSRNDPDATSLTPPGSVTPTAGRATKPSGSGALAVGDQFGRYTIIGLLGVGGMGAVYKAWDQELEVVVALKVIKPEVMRDPVAGLEIERRFKRELLLARQVTHKNVVRIHDLGEINGIKYITMTFVDGTDLATLVKSEGRLPVAKTLHVMREVVSGLVAAHAAGVVHRDLKPANIMIDREGGALIMDFGIARSTSGPADTAAAAGAAPAGAPAPTGRYTAGTMLGSIIGTVEYMAPEQARGHAVDQRSDIYTTGLILYDLLSGVRRSEQPGNAFDQLRARIENPLPPIKAAAPDVPDALAAIVMRAVELDPANRFQKTAEFAAALERLDASGVPKPVKRAVSLPLMASIVVVLLALSGTAWYFTRPEPPAVAHEPVSVVIADFENQTGDPTFDRTLEPMLRRALEGASFITAYDRNGIARTVGATLPAKLDESAARELAVKQGLGVVLSGVINKQGNGYGVSMKATQTFTGKVVSSVNGKASGQDQVIATATRLVSSVRKALGDPTSESAQIFAMTSLSASSLDVVRLYAAAMESSSNNQFDDARASLVKAVELDPKFGVGYLALAGVSRNQQKPEDAVKYVNEALSHLDGMTERERYSTRGMFYRLTGDYQQCVKEHTELIARFAADVVGRNQLAICASQLRDIARARDEMLAIVKILPERAVFRDNLALYSDYISDFATGEREARIVQQKAKDKSQPADDFAGLALGLAQIGQSQLTEAADTFKELASAPKLGPTFSASGLADLAAYEGRYAEAVSLFDMGAAANIAEKKPALAAAKFAEQANVQLMRGQKAAAIAAATKALDQSKAVKIRFLAARTFIEAGQAAKAQPLMSGLAAELQPEPQAYGKILEAMMSADPRSATKLLADANSLLDTWIGHFELGRAYLKLGQFPQADSEFDRCTKRRGEALTLFLDEEPTSAFFPVVYYYWGQVREGLKSAGAAESYRTYLAIREKAGEDPLIADIRRRIGK